MNRIEIFFLVLVGMSIGFFVASWFRRQQRNAREIRASHEETRIMVESVREMQEQALMVGVWGNDIPDRPEMNMGTVSTAGYIGTTAGESYPEFSHCMECNNLFLMRDMRDMGDRIICRACDERLNTTELEKETCDIVKYSNKRKLIIRRR